MVVPRFHVLQIQRDNADPAIGFPYCGFLIDTKTLELGMDHSRILSSRKFKNSGQML